ncbi:MAG: choice-of-anchor D domain-containing protein [Planctomycetes bacterium]|nr:choice-of-anchor D domain-containing protein [Planctomycetota bacterium]
MKMRLNVLLIVVIFSSLLISCTSTAVSVKFSITKHDFGTVNIGEFSAIDIIITNKKIDPLTLTQMSTNIAEFNIIAGGTPGTMIQGKADHIITVQFVPDLPGGIKDAILQIDYDFGTKPKIKEISLTGQAVPVPRIEVDPTTKDWGDVVINNTETQDFIIENTGTSDLTVFSANLSGPDASIFAITAGNVGGTIAPQDILVVTVEITPITTGNKSAVLEIEHDGVNEGTPLNIDLVGNCIDIPIFEIAPPSPFDFQKASLGDTKTETFTISNVGGRDLTITAIAVAGDFTVTAGNAPFTITAGNSHTVDIRFAPQSVGIVNENIVFTNTAPTSPDTLEVTGEGFRGLPFTEDFESTAIAQIPTDWTITRDSGSNTAGTQWSWQVPSWGSNTTGGSGKFVICDSDRFANAIYRDYIVTPTIDCSSYSTGTVTLEFDMHFDYLSADTAKVEVYDGATWHTLQTWTSDTTGHKSFNITTHALSNSDLKVRFYYSNTMTWMWYFKLDNVEITRN